MLPLDHAAAVEAMIGATFRVTYRTRDNRGTADFVRDVPAADGCRAIDQVRWLLLAAHPADHTEYEFKMCVRVERAEVSTERRKVKA